MQGNPFQQAEDEFHRLVGQFAAGRITQEQLESALRALMVQDEKGRWWMLGAKTGQWHVHDGNHWTPAQPPTPAAPATPISLSEQPTLARPVQPVAFPLSVTPGVPDVPRITKSRKGNSLPLVLGAVVLVLGLVVIGALVLLNFLQPKTTVIIAPYGTPAPVALATSPAGTVSSGTPGAVLARATSEPLLSRAQYLANNDSLTGAIANLNRAELKFIQDANASLSRNAPARIAGLAAPAPYAPNIVLLDADLREMAAAGMSVGNLARELGRTAGTYDKASDAAVKVAEQYYGIARTGYAIVIESQNMRDDLNAGKLDLRNWANKIADYGARLWNQSVSGGSAGQPPANPFLAYHAQPATVPVSKFLDSKGVAAVKAQMDAGSSISSWVASAQKTVTRKVSMPPPKQPVDNLYDADLWDKLKTAAGQVNGDAARQVAGGLLQETLLQQGVRQFNQDPRKAVVDALSIDLPDGMMVADAAQAAKSLPTFKDGTAAALARSDKGDDPFSHTFLTPVDTPPKAQGKVSVDAKPEYPVQLAIELKEIVKTDSGDPPRYRAFATVRWNTSLTHPQFTLLCIGAEPAELSVTTNSGEQVFSQPEIPRHSIFVCNAMRPDSIYGHVSTRFDVGNPADIAKHEQQKKKEEEAEEQGFQARIDQAKADAEASRVAEAKTRTAKLTEEAVGKEVAGTQTAEFRATITQMARMTAQAQKAGTAASVKATQDAIAGNVFTMNGTFNFSLSGSPFAGIIQVSVDLNTGKASGYIKANPRNSTYQDSCNPSITHKSGSDFEGELKGTVNSQTGALELNGSPSGNAYNEGDCGTPALSPGLGFNLKLTGAVDVKSHTGKGRLECVQVSCDGDWHAGQ